MGWLLAAVCGLMCFGFLIEAELSVTVQHPIRVALAGETLPLTFSVTVPKNQSSDKFVCCRDIDNKVLYTSSISETKTISWNLTVSNRADSGEYSCEYKKIRAYWIVLVREVGYRESDSRTDALLLLNVVLSVGLFLFSFTGSIILLKDYRLKLGDERTEEGGGGGEGEGEGEGEGVTEEGDEDATNSVYTALEHGTSSIYNVLDPSAKDSSQKRVQQQETNKPCVTQNSQKEDGIFESVYENF
ncbi:uncharacterized protein LOC118220295 [Anguilla anguilla]|uniref:uncharacterized protein LOC118220295 n=1 Tax=Anguilla anguilla TaxID=7936 RepID=UPI0015A95352|nr:uncharacterized protein LOC118220295 [Anguilla anguilla]